MTDENRISMELSPQEQALIAAFRALTPKQQEKLLELARTKKLDQGRKGAHSVMGRGY